LSTVSNAKGPNPLTPPVHTWLRAGVNIGLFCSTPAVALARSVGKKKSMEMLLTGEMLSADMALQAGLLNHVLDDCKQLDSHVSTLAQHIATKAPVAIAMGKHTFNRQIDMPLAEAYDIASDTMVRNLQKADATEGIRAFLEKRPPVWTNE